MNGMSKIIWLTWPRCRGSPLTASSNSMSSSENEPSTSVNGVSSAAPAKDFESVHGNPAFLSSLCFSAPRQVETEADRRHGLDGGGSVGVGAAERQVLTDEEDELGLVRKGLVRVRQRASGKG